MKKLLTLLIAFVLCYTNIHALPDEGMWLPMYIKNYNYATMQKLGLKLTAEQLYDINESSLKDAIVQLGDFCTAEMISPQGLMLTNHHCGYEMVTLLSSKERDILKDGFWAYSQVEELPCPGLTATFLVRMENVTDILNQQIKDSLKDKSNMASLREELIAKMQKNNSENGLYTVEIKDFFAENEYYMFVYQTYKDVRLAGVPPSSIGKFGGDTDNWMWPRHTGDFCLFRVYTGADGVPAEYDIKNKPYTPKHYLPINIQGVKEGDYAMIFGYPGETQRYITSYEIQNMLDTQNPEIIKMGDVLLPIMRQAMNDNDEIRYKYASTYAQISNFWKNKTGETKNLNKLHILAKKQKEEQILKDWINADTIRQQKYGHVLSDIQKNMDSMRLYASQNALWQIQIALMSSKLYMSLIPMVFGQTDISEYQNVIQNCDLALEQDLMEVTLNTMVLSSSSSDYQMLWNFINKEFKGNIHDYVTEMFKVFQNEKSFVKQFKSKKSPFLNYIYTIYGIISQYYASFNIYDSEIQSASKLLVQAKREMRPDIYFYPDANFTMRCTYGKVADYIPSDAVYYDYYTTYKGILEKEIPGDDEFDVDTNLKKLLIAKDFGRYAKDGELRICFITDNDITGGNSGSPVLNANGELIGCAFDGNWEAMSSDIAFEPNMQRTICVDARYILFVIDKLGKANNLVNEMKIIE